MAAVHCTLHRLHAQTVIKGVKEKNLVIALLIAPASLISHDIRLLLQRFVWSFKLDLLLTARRRCQ